MISAFNSRLSSTGSKPGNDHRHIIYVPGQNAHHSASFYPLMGTGELNAGGTCNPAKD